MVTTVQAPVGESPAPMSHREIMEALSGLLLGLFVTMVSSTIVTNALPTIVADLGGGESTYTWVVTSALLATTASTPIWGKLADLMSKKLLVQLGLAIFVVGSAAAGLAQNIGELIAARTIQGVGAGGMIALVQVIMAAMIAPRERGRYSGYIGVAYAAATVTGPLLGGVVTQTSWLGWRWCFYVGVPVAAVASVVLQRTLHLPVLKRGAGADAGAVGRIKIDYLGAVLISAAVSLLLVWVSLGGSVFAWASWQTAVMVPGAIVLGALFVWTETRAAEPIIPLGLFRSRTVVLSTLASGCVGVGIFGATVFLSQYFQIARGASPTESGLLTLPMIAGMTLASLISGRVITATGRWKYFLVAGSAVLTVGLALLGTARYDTGYPMLVVYMALVGAGLGMVLQNLVLAVQNAVPIRELGTASATVAFFRTLGGAVGVSALGALLSARVTGYLADGLRTLGVPAPADSGSVPDLDTLPAPVRHVVQQAYGHATGDLFLAAAPIPLVALIAVLFLKETRLRSSNAAPATEAPATETPATVRPGGA